MGQTGPGTWALVPGLSVGFVPGQGYAGVASSTEYGAALRASVMARSNVMARSKVGPDNVKRNLIRTKSGSRQAVWSQADITEVSRTSNTSSGYSVAAQLQQLLDDPSTPAAARVNAARTLAEINGVLGKHQLRPERGASQPLASLSREELEAELRRLRDLIGLGLIG